MSKHIVLVEPKYYSTYPPIGLLKLSAYEKSKGNTTELVRKGHFSKRRPDKIYITSLFTWAWEPVWREVRKYKAWYPEVPIWIGGLYASLLPVHAKLSGADHIHVGLQREAEDILPDYSLVPEWDGSIIFASRGCINACPFCAVPILEGKICSEKTSIKKYVWPEHTKLIFFDNNILASRNWRSIFEEIISLSMEVDFNQGLDAKLLSREVASFISKMNIPRIRLAYDRPSQRDYVERAIKILSDQGISKRHILVYTLYNFNESPEDFLSRVIDILDWGSVCYPMRFQPNYTTKKDDHISQKWTKEKLDILARARRVIGYGGAFPPYKGLIKKLRNASNFHEAFSLYQNAKLTEPSTSPITLKL